MRIINQQQLRSYKGR